MMSHPLLLDGFDVDHCHFFRPFPPSLRGSLQMLVEFGHPLTHLTPLR
jgi:hypothetical protein